MKKKNKCISIIFTLIIFINNIVSFPVYGVESKESYLVNKNGETYGNLLTAKKIGYEPDLIEAIGISGVEGYVKRVELNLEEPSNPIEAINQTRNLKSRTINLYNEDGITVVDSFVVEKPLITNSSARSTTRSDFVYGNPGPVSLNGLNYETIAGIRSIWRGVTGITSVATIDGRMIPAGHVGVKVRIIKKSDGKLVKESEFLHNTTSRTELSISDSHTSLWVNEEYYNEGFVRIHDGMNYITYSTYHSPTVTPTWI